MPSIITLLASRKFLHFCSLLGVAYAVPLDTDSAVTATTANWSFSDLKLKGFAPMQARRLRSGQRAT